MAVSDTKFPKMIAADLSAEKVVSAPLGAFSPVSYTH